MPIAVTEKISHYLGDDKLGNLFHLQLTLKTCVNVKLKDCDVIFAHREKALFERCQECIHFVTQPGPLVTRSNTMKQFVNIRLINQCSCRNVHGSCSFIVDSFKCHETVCEYSLNQSMLMSKCSWFLLFYC